jgi:hypothetical protein
MPVPDAKVRPDAERESRNAFAKCSLSSTDVWFLVALLRPNSPIGDYSAASNRRVSCTTAIECICYVSIHFANASNE